MPEPIVELPPNLPPELAELGPPAEVFAPDPAKRLILVNVVIAVAAGIAALAAFAVALNFMGVFLLPGQKPPPRGVQIGVGLTSTLLGALFLGAALWFGCNGGACTQTYLLYRTALAEVFPDRHRVVAWERLRRPKHITSWMASYRFPVQGDKDVRFDYTMPNHERLGKAILARCFVSAMGGDAACAALADTEPPPFFLARRPSFFGGETYRVSRVGRCLVFLKVGEGHMTDRPAVYPMGGLGAVAAAGPVWRYEKFRANMDKVASANELALLQHAVDLPGSFLVAEADIQASHVGPVSLWASLNGGFHAGTWTMTHAVEGTMTLQLLTTDDVLTASREVGVLRRAPAALSPP